MHRLRLALLPLAAAVAAAAAPGASASQLIDRNAENVRLEVNRQGMAMLSYTAAGRSRHVLAWDAVDAIAPTAGKRQVAFKLDYAGGWGAFRKDAWRTFTDACRPVSVPLQWLVTACQAPDGSYWAVQSWQRALPNYGLVANATQSVWELRLAHWTGDLPTLDVRFGWAYRRFVQIYGRLTYRGGAVHGFRSTADGQPLDTFGRNIYVDTLDSAYGAGWRRENSFLTHKGTGGFCYGFYPHGSRPSGHGTRYRATVIGPGVLPDVYWEGSGPAAYDREFDLAADSDLLSLLAGDGLCHRV